MGLATDSLFRILDTRAENCVLRCELGWIDIQFVSRCVLVKRAYKRQLRGRLSRVDREGDVEVEIKMSRVE